LHAPAAGFGDTEFYLDSADKAGVFAVHLAKNHPLPDGNRRPAWVALRLFIELNGRRWEVAPSVDDAERAVLRDRRGHVGRGPSLRGGFAVSWTRRITEGRRSRKPLADCAMRLSRSRRANR
jgi:hypothetical protein